MDNQSPSQDGDTGYAKMYYHGYGVVHIPNLKFQILCGVFILLAVLM